MTGQDLMMEMQNKMATLDAALRQIGKRGETYAKAEQDYRTALASKMLLERDNGTPVTILSDICRGTPEIAQKKLNRDIAESLYKVALEACNVYKLQIRILENHIEREWGAAKNE